MNSFSKRIYFVGLILSYLFYDAYAGTVYKTILREGTGPIPQINQTVIVHYTGTLATGGKFDSSHDRKEPFKFRLGVGEVIRGWDAGVSSMKVGERARIEIAPEDAYGTEGLPPVIPQSATLMFDIELLGIEGVSPPTVQVKNTAPVDPSVQTIPGSQTDPLFPSYPSSPDQTFGGGTSQGRIFTLPDLPGSNDLGQSLRGNVFSPNQIGSPQQTSGGLQGIGSPRNPSQGQSFGTPNSLNPNLPGLTFGSSTDQGQTFNPPDLSAQNNLLSPNQPIRSGQSQGFPQPGVSSTGQTGGGPFSGNNASPSQDISRMEPILTPQERPDFGRLPQLPSDWNQQPAGVSPSSPGGASRFSPERLPQQFANQGGMVSQGRPQGQSSGFRPPIGRDSFSSRRSETGVQQGGAQSTGSRVNAPDLNNFGPPSLDAGSRFQGSQGMPSTGPSSFGPSAPRERFMLDGMDFAAPGMPRSRFGGPQFPDPRMMGNMDPTMPRGDIGLDRSFPEMFPGREFTTGSRRMGRPTPGFFRSRGGGFPRGPRDPGIAGMERFPEIDPRAVRGFPSRRFRRDRDPVMMMMMMERARRARMRRGF